MGPLIPKSLNPKPYVNPKPDRARVKQASLQRTLPERQGLTSCCENFFGGFTELKTRTS